MSKCWVVGRWVRIVSSGNEYITEPYIVFEDEDEAIAARDMIWSVSGERVEMREASFYPRCAALEKGEGE